MDKFVRRTKLMRTRVESIFGVRFAPLAGEFLRAQFTVGIKFFIGMKQQPSRAKERMKIVVQSEQKTM